MGDWQERANERRDERSIKTPDTAPKYRGKKNTKRWCGGVQGREHAPECMDGMKARGRKHLEDWRYLVCTTCGKELALWCGENNIVQSKPKPPWVTD